MLNKSHFKDFIIIITSREPKLELQLWYRGTSGIRTIRLEPPLTKS
jgi:hypothetical protein